MALPDLNAFCIQLFPQNRLCIVFPGGTEICAAFADARVPDPSEYTAALINQANSALAPLVPIFNIIDVIIAVVNCFKAVEKALGPPPDPSKIADCFPDLAKKIAKLLKLLPQLSIPVLIGGLLDVVIANLQGLRTQIDTIIKKQLRLLRAATRASKLGSVALRTSVDCATGNLDAFLQNMNKNAAPLGRFILLLNALLKLAGLPEIPGVDDLKGDAKDLLAPIDATIARMKQVRAGFP